MPYDLVDEMQWEDLEDFLTLEEAGLIDGYNDDTVPGMMQEYFIEEGRDV